MLSKVRRVTFPAAGNGPPLEAVLHLPKRPAPSPAAVVCHPHPLMGGDMHNRVVVAVCRELVAHGWLALRFNFRGVGRSDGSFDEGRGEMEDVSGAIDFLITQPQADSSQLAVIGYSFGAGVGLRHAARDPRVNGLIGIALTQRHYADPFLDQEPRPKLFIVGERDEWAPPDALRRYVARLHPPHTVHVIPHTDHFFARRESKVAQRIVEFLLNSAGEHAPQERAVAQC